MFKLRIYHLVITWVISIVLFFMIETKFIAVLPATEKPLTSRNARPVFPNSSFNMNRTELRLLLNSILKRHTKLYYTSNYKFNVRASNNLSLDREVPDLRPEKCKSIVYNIHEPLSVSVVIIFHNDALTMILRTVHSVINRSPASMLKEIILVDDLSSYADLGAPLDQYVSKLTPVVRIIRNKKREGLVRSRLNGASNATSDIIIFLDAHMECSPGWLEPLVYELQQNHAAVVQPHVDQISAEDMTYFTNDDKVNYRSGIGWDLSFVWYKFPKYLHQIRQSQLELNFPTPILVGCAIGVWKSNFDRIGRFDDKLNIWGGEHIELSLRTWLCGGRVITVPCSRVGHLFKQFAYSFNAKPAAVIFKNLYRVAHLWLGEYLWIYLSITHDYNISFTPSELKSIAKRRSFFQEMKCKSFSWFLESVMPELPVPTKETLYFGEIFHVDVYSSLCLRVLDNNYITTSDECTSALIVPQATFSLTSGSKLKHFHQCVVPDKNGFLIISECSLNATWAFSESTRQLILTSANHEKKCATLSHYFIKMLKCAENNQNQQWKFRYNKFWRV